MDLEISPGYIDCTHKIGAPSKGENRLRMVNLPKCIFTNKKRQKGKNHVNYRNFN